MQKRSQKSWSNCWTGHSQEIVIHQWNLAKTGLNKNNGSENPLISDVYDNNYKLNSNNPDTSLKESKKTLRTELSKKRSILSAEFIAKSSDLICGNFLSTNFYNQAENIALYYPIKNEVNPLSVFHYSVNLGKNILFPKIANDSLSFYEVNRLEDLLLSKFGIYEPGEGLKRMETEEIDLFIVPGLAFDKKGNRLGYGKGFYDNALRSISSSKIMGFCYFFQILDFIPSGGSDKDVGYLVCEDGVLSCKS